MKRPYLLRAEAVNLEHFLYDTPRLPTVRGGGLLLLRAPQEIKAYLEASGRLEVETLRSGASAAVFSLATETAQAAAIRDDLERWLGEHPDLRHATFVVDVLPASDDFQRDLESLLALNRFRQSRAPSVAYPAEAGSGACAVDRIRPAIEQQSAPGGETNERVSASVAVRTEYGRAQKQAFYREETSAESGRSPAFLARMQFASDFHDLADDEDQGRLNGKMAVLYLDGNSFGKIQRELCPSAADAQRFDRYLQGQRRAMLRAVLERIHAEPQGWLSPKGTYRFETLLWGGDECLFVVPAWKGWWLLSDVYRHIADWNFDHRPLTFAGGLVFCHSKAPIRRIKDLAARLAEEAKGVSRERNLAAYQVLESFDLIAGDLHAFRAARSPSGSADQLLVAGEKAAALGNAIEGLKPRVARKPLYRLIDLLLASGPGADTSAAWRALEATAPATAWSALAEASVSREAGALHLAELWDYLPKPAQPREVDVDAR